jgi:hypothetical protein
MPVARMAKNTTNASTAPEKILKPMINLPCLEGETRQAIDHLRQHNTL